MSEKKRRKWTGKEKLRIVLTCMQPGVEVSEVCRREGINPNMYYNWKKKLLASASQVFEEKPKKRNVDREKAQEELSRLKDVIAQITAENLELKKNAFGLEDYGKMPSELQERVHEEVELTKRRSDWPAGKTLTALGVSRTTYYRWLREEAWAKAASPPPGPSQPYEALPEEKAAVKEYALKHPELRHRELCWRMVDDDVAYVSPSTTYRILREAKLICPWRRRSKRRREDAEKAQRPNQIWATDIKYVWVGERHYFLICFLDEYSRYIVHHELLWGIGGDEVSLAAQAALETLPRDVEGRLLERPEIRSDNGSCYISREFGGVLDEYGLTHRRIKPHCPEENGLIERANRTLGEVLEGEELTDYLQAVKVLGRLIRWYNEDRLHSALGFLRPVDYYRGHPEELYAERRRKLIAARHERREKNLQLRQPTLPLTSEETVA